MVVRACVALDDHGIGCAMPNDGPARNHFGGAPVNPWRGRSITSVETTEVTERAV
jgi:hypothetical protein